MTQQTGKYIIAIGLLIIVVGVVVYFFNSKLHWLGKLPGDISVEKQNFKFYFPVATMIIISLVVNLIIWLIKKTTSP
jgi:H+/Cl- antiporter ClcA